MREQDPRPPDARRPVILEAVKDEIADPEHVTYVLPRVEEEIQSFDPNSPTR